MSPQLDPVRAAALAGMSRPGSVGFQREVPQNIIDVSWDRDAGELCVYTQNREMVLFGVLSLLAALATAVVLMILLVRGGPGLIPMWAIVPVLAVGGTALVWLSSRRNVFTREGERIRMKLVGHRAEVLPAPVSHVDAYGILNVSPVMPSERGIEGGDRAAALIGGLLFGAIGAAVVATLSRDWSAGEKLTGPPGAPEVHVYLEGNGRIRFHHAARQKRILIHAYVIARFFGVEMRNRT